MITILHTGQTGVERGADTAARTVGFSVGGYCQLDSRDELGPIPVHIAADLKPVTTRGARVVWAPTLDLADVLVIIAPTVSKVRTSAGLGVLRTLARAARVPYIIVDDASDLDEVAGRLRALETNRRDLAIMVCGPRATRWAHGERRALQLVGAIAAEPAAVAYRVLVVDDYPETAAVIGRVVSMLGHEPIIATTAAQALACAEKRSPDVGLFDIGLPDMNGYDLARRIRRGTSDPLFLAAITGKGDAHDSERAYEAGFNEYVVKPVGVDLIAGILATATDRLLAACSTRSHLRPSH